MAFSSGVVCSYFIVSYVRFVYVLCYVLYTCSLVGIIMADDEDNGFGN